MKAVRLTADEEKAILDAWFETVHFDIESQGLPALKSEEDDEETRAAAIMAWFSGSYVEPIPEDIEDSDWLKVDEESIGMSRSAAKEFLEREQQFQELFGVRMNPYHDKAGKFASKGGVSIGAGGATVKDGLDAQQATQLRGKLHQPDGGFTLNLHTGQEATSGFAVAVHESRSVDIPEKELTVDHLQEYVGKNGEIFADPRNMLGAWHDPNSGSVWLDVSTVVGDRDEAIALAQKHNQISIFNLDNFEVINTGGTGRSSYWQTTGRTISEERIKAYGRWRLALRDGGLLPKEFSRRANPENLFVGGFVDEEDRFNPNHSKKDGKFTNKSGGGMAVGKDRTEEFADTLKDGYHPPYSFVIGDPVDRALVHVASLQGFDGKPTKGSIEDTVKAGGIEIHRGLTPSKRFGKSADDIHNEMMSGKYEPGKGNYGNGYYFSTSEGIAKMYASKPIVDGGYTAKPVEGGKTVRAALKPGAKIADYATLKAERDKWFQAQKDRVHWDQYKTDFQTPKGKIYPEVITQTNDPGIFATLMGYDAIRVPLKERASDRRNKARIKKAIGSDDLGDEIVVLNRTALVVEE